MAETIEEMNSNKTATSLYDLKRKTSRFFESPIYLSSNVCPMNMKGFGCRLNTFINDVRFYTFNFFTFWVNAIFKIFFVSRNIFAKSIVRMLLVIGICHPLQITNHIIGLYSVFMINARKIIRVIKKNFSYKPVYPFKRPNPIYGKGYLAVTKLGYMLFYSTSFLIWPVSKRVWHTSNVAVVANFVVPLKKYNWHP